MNLDDVIKLTEQAFKEKFIGNFIVPENDIEDLYRLATKRIKSQGLMFPEVVFLAIVNAVKDWDSGEFWKHIFDKLHLTESIGFEGEINGQEKLRDKINKLVIDELGKDGKILYLDNYKKKFYATMLCHAFTPKRSIESLFDLCWKIYTQDLDCEFFEEDSNFDILVTQLRARFDSDVEENKVITLGSAVYSFRAGIRGLALRHQAEMKKLIVDIIRWMHIQLNGNDLSKLNASNLEQGKYLYELANNWWQNHIKEIDRDINDEQNGRERRKRIGGYTVASSQIHVKYFYDDGSTYIYIPAFRLEGNLEKKPWIEMFVNGQQVISKEMDTRGSGLQMKSREKYINVSEYAIPKETMDIVIYITHEDKMIYNSNECDNLKREFIIFSDSGRERFDTRLVEGNYLLYTWYGPEQFNLLPRSTGNDRKYIYGIYAEAGERIECQNKTIFFVSFDGSVEGHFDQKDLIDNVSFRFANVDYKIITNNIKFVVPSELDIRDLVVKTDEKLIRLSNAEIFPCSEINGFKYFDMYNVQIDRQPQILQIMSLKTNKVIDSINVIKFEYVKIKYDKPIYYDKFTSGNVLVVVGDFINNVDFSIFEEEVIIPMTYGEIVLNPPVIKWRIEDNEWNYQVYEKGLWCGNISELDKITVSLPGKHCYEMFVNGVGANNLIVKRDKKNNRFLIGETIKAINFKEFNSVMLFTKITDITRGIAPLVTVYLQEQFINNTPFVVDANSGTVWLNLMAFRGDGDSKIKLVINSVSGDKCEREYIVNEPNVNISDILEQDGKVEIYLKCKGLFVTKDKLLWQGIWTGTEFSNTDD